MADDELLPEGVTAASLNTLWARWASQGLLTEGITRDTYTSFANRIPEEIRPPDRED